MRSSWNGWQTIVTVALNFQMIPQNIIQKCELESIISYAALDKEFDDNLAQMIIENGKPCKCKNFSSLN